jgi:type IV pilus assembly protein PilY1
MAVTSQAASDLKGDLSAIRLGYGRINYSNNGPDPWNPYGARLNGASFPELDNDPQPPPHPGAVVRGVRDFTDVPGNPNRQQFFDWIFSLNWVGSTPNREALDSIGTYYLRANDFGPWSDNPGNGGGRQGDQHASCRRSFAILATDGEWTAIPESPPVPPAQPLITNRTADPVGAGGGTVTASLATTGPQIDGAGLYQGQSYNYDPAVEVEYSTGNGGVTATLTDVALYWWSRDLRPGIPNAVQKRTNPDRPDDSFWQNMSTFVVGYGLNASMDTPAVRQLIVQNQQTPQVHNAVNWPVVDTSPALVTGGERINDTMRAALASRGDFYSANDPDQMRGRIRGVFKAIAERPFSGTGLGATSAQLSVGSTLYRASFVTQTWTGQLAAYDAMALAQAAQAQQQEPAALWTAGFPAWDQRKIYTSTGPNTATAFDTLTSLDAAQQAALTSQEVLEYVRGRKLGLEVSSKVNNTTLGFRDRTTLLGSIVSSSPRYSKAPNFGYSLNPAAGGGNQYAAHVASNTANRRPTVFVGANAGMFHAFDARRDPNVGGGQELFAYVPRAVYPYLKELTNVEYVHRYFVDGPVVEGDVYLNNAWKTVVMGSTGAGPAGLFALDVTSPENFDQSKVLWDITAAEEPDLGRVMGHGYIGSVKYQQNGGKWVAIVPNGYESTNNRAVLLIIDMATGQTLRKIDTCKRNDGTPFGANEQGGRCQANELNGLANVSVIYDASRNVVGAFSGDYQGNVWRFDLSSSDPAQWRIATEDPVDQSGNTPAPLFTARNAANQRQPVVAAPRASTHPFGGTYLVFGTGKFFEYTDQSNTELQSIYGLWLKPGDKAPIAKTDLQGLGLDESTQNNVVVRTLSGTSGFSWRTKRGWYVDLVANNQSPLGERVIADPVVQRGVLFMTSFQPTTAGNPCEGGGTSYFYAIGMDASLNSFSSTQVSGVVSSVYPLTNETAVSGQPDTNINLGEATSGMSDTSRTRDANGNVSISNPALQCLMMYNQVNVKAGLVDRACNYAFPVRTWRPIR